MIYYYVDPGAGFVFAQGSSFIWGIILAILGGGLFFLKFFFHFLKKIIWIIVLLAILLVIGGLLMSANKINKKVIILGIDAMDPVITERLMQEGKLPNLARLKTTGSYARLASTIPSETVVVWTSFATGLNPGAHGIFDFVMRDPETYQLYLSLNDISTASGKVKIRIRKKGEGFWRVLSKHKIPSFIYFLPNTFPVEPVKGRMVSGMGVPDITGTMGKYSWYTTKPVAPEDADSRGRIIHVGGEQNAISTQLYGPRLIVNNTGQETKVAFEILIKPEEKGSYLEFQGHKFFLEEGKWSAFYKIKFKLGFLNNINGIVRFYLKSMQPDFQLYASPINFDPQNPAFPVSYPLNYSGELSRKVGLYYTQGMPHDTWALPEGRLDEKAFLEMADEIFSERKNILYEGLKEFKAGVFFFYLDTLDAVQHLFWRYQDPAHALYEANSAYQQTIPQYYRKIDALVGDLLKNLDKDTTLIILSDHGFSSFRRAVSLNRWLLENGYLVLRPGVDEGREFFEDVDWAKTRAYALGFGGIYLNLVGREGNGIVSGSESPALKQEIVDRLKQLKDPQIGEYAVKNVYIADKIYQGDYVKDAPDLFVGFNAGYRASWQTALGGVPKTLIEENKKKWSGDHLIDYSLVPGVIFINKKLRLSQPQVIDIAPTILGEFGIDKPGKMQGKRLF